MTQLVLGSQSGRGYTELQCNTDLEQEFCGKFQVPNDFTVLQHWEEELRSILLMWFNHGRKDSMKVTLICLNLKK